MLIIKVRNVIVPSPGFHLLTRFLYILSHKYVIETVGYQSNYAFTLVLLDKAIKKIRIILR